VHVARLRMFYDVPASMKPAPLRTRLIHLRFGASDSPEIKTAIYRWEFLRRNPDYHADYHRFIGSFGDWLKDRGDWGDSETRTNWTKSDQKYFHIEIEPVLTELYRKWELCNLFPPELGLKEWTQGYESAQDGRDFPPTCLSADGKRDSHSIRELKRMGFEGTGMSARKYQNLLLIQVDLNSPMKDILDYVRQALRYAKRTHRRGMNKHAVKPPQRRRRFEHYDQYLKIWDLKQQGKTRAEIAKLVFPRYSLESALTRVRDHLKAANKLISGQFKEIR
jgi:hypothetical protein